MRRTHHSLPFTIGHAIIVIILHYNGFLYFSYKSTNDILRSIRSICDLNSADVKKVIVNLQSLSLTYFIIYKNRKEYWRINVIYFCPFHSEWFEDLNDININYDICCPIYNLRASEENQTIIDKWNTVSAPPAPELKSITVNPRTTALLILDIENSICNTPHCIATIPNIYDLLTKARQHDMLVVYSLIPTANSSDIAKQIAPLPSDPIVKSNVDKFYNTNLEEILSNNGIKNVIITGYAANGAVLHTATSAAFRGYNVIIPVDCMSANNPYAEQYTAWHMINSPGTMNRAFLTKVNLIGFQTS